ncbi:unnamed protein product [Moneuplotes crassus]|uniref:Band 7 domain-containing protein n=2 Tax=Euplotes crassus TaxID=5936 RepID=A0AAD1UTP0_EUPCR|nr:unnamed protein product [Moneuplotes crassus]
MALNERTHLLQITTGDITNAPRILKNAQHDGQPIVVVIENGFCCCKPKLDVPSGVTVLSQKWGAHDGELAPGFKCCWCKHKKIAAIITMNSIRYDAPIKNCPTKDNVRVWVDISLTFRIGPGHDECMKFIYELGPAKLDQMLEAESEEAIRNFVYGVKLAQIQDIKGEIASTLLQDLNRKFVEFGVYFENVHILQIKIPDQLQKTLSDTTAFDIKLQNQIKKHQNAMLVLENDQNQKLTELQRKNGIKIEELKAANERALISREEKKVNALSDYEVRMTDAKSKASVLMTKVNGEKDIIENESKKEVLEMVNQAKTQCAEKKRKADHEATVLTIKADSQYEAAKAKYEAALIEAQAEADNKEGLSKLRTHELSMARAEVMQELARNSDIVFGGKSGEALLGEFLP